MAPPARPQQRPCRSFCGARLTTQNTRAGRAKAQQGFITYLLRPLLEEWLQVLPTLQPLLAALEENLSHLAQWETEQTGPPHVTLRQ